MSVIQPQGMMYLLRGIPLTSAYEHTIYFPNESEQYRYFYSHVFRSFNKLSYVADGMVKLEIPCDEIRECSYLMYRNTGFENKWFYAFIESVQRISNNVTLVTFTIDVMQTWFLFNTDLRPCMVEREHVDDDTPGKHIIPEGLETGDYKIQSRGNIGAEEGYSYIFAVTQYLRNDQWVNAAGGIYSGLYSGVVFLVAGSGNEAGQIVNRYNAAGRGDAILTISVVPKWFYDDYGEDNLVKPFITPKFKEYTVKVDPEHLTPFEGYYPYNNKLYCYPYQYMIVTNHDGNELELRYEYFKNHEAKLRLVGCLSCAPQALLFPLGYLTIDEVNKLQMINSSVYSQIAFTTDNYRSWLAQTAATRATSISLGKDQLALATSNALLNQKNIDQNLIMTETQNKMNYAASAGDAALSALTMNAGGLMAAGSNVIEGIAFNQIRYDILSRQGQMEKNNAAFSVSSALHSIRGINAQVQDHSVIPPSAKGNATTDSLQIAGLKEMEVYSLYLRKDYARRIDMFFQMYGYQVNDIKIPNIHVRDLWTYTKTVNCNVKPKEGSGCSAADLNNINTVFNHGITFWNGELGMNNFMEYDQENKVI